MKAQTKQIIVGSLLGDGWLERQSASGTAMFRVKYSDKSKKYLEWLRDRVGELNPSDLKSVPRYSQHYFYTEARRDIGDLYNLFYPKGRKSIPRNIAHLLVKPIGLAVWYQDDGTLDKRSGYHHNALFATHCFSFEECLLLTNVLRRNFGITTSVCKCQMRGKMYYRLYVVSKSMGTFIKTIRPFIHPHFQYKIR